MKLGVIITAGSRSDLRWMEHQTPPKIKKLRRLFFHWYRARVPV
jgi:hypothetical protein